MPNYIDNVPSSNPSPLPPTRRTVLAGAAWTLPVVAAATVSPFAAASDAVTLAFDKSTYSGVACQTITAVAVIVTVNGIPTAGRNVTVTLSNGYTFGSSGSQVSATSGSNGRANLPTITVPASGGNGSLTATSANAKTATANVSAPGNGVAKNWRNGKITSFDSIPAGATPLGGNNHFWVGGDIWYGNKKIVSGGVTAASGVSAYGDRVNYIQNGVAKSWAPDGQATHDKVPSTAIPLGGNQFFRDGTNIWYANKIILTGVTAAWGLNQYIYDRINYIQDGVAKNWAADGGRATFTKIPADATPLGSNQVFLSGTDVWNGNNKVLTGVSAVAGIAASGYARVNYVQDGVAKSWNSSSGSTTWKSIPAGAIPLGGNSLFRVGNDVWYGNTKVLSNVVSTVGLVAEDVDYVNFTTATCP